MAKAAIKSHAPALYSLALIQFNGSGGIKNDKDLRAGVALCARAAFLGHNDALRELGHCLQDGYGCRKNVEEGRRLLLQANARELASVLRAANTTPSPLPFQLHSHQFRFPMDLTDSDGSPYLTDSNFRLSNDYRCNLPAQEVHPANRFLVEWFGLKRRGFPGQGMRMCSYGGCGRPETRMNEFRRCSGCGMVNYCSRGCQAQDWRVHHKVECAPMEEWVGRAIDDVEDGEEIDDDRTVQIEKMDGGVDGMHV